MRRNRRLRRNNGLRRTSCGWRSSSAPGSESFAAVFVLTHEDLICGHGTATLRAAAGADLRLDGRRCRVRARGGRAGCRTARAGRRPRDRSWCGLRHARDSACARRLRSRRARHVARAARRAAGEQRGTWLSAPSKPICSTSGGTCTTPQSLIVCLGDTLTHLESTDDVERLVRDVATSLRPGGRFVATFRDYTHPAAGVRALHPRAQRRESHSHLLPRRAARSHARARHRA